MTRSIDVDMRRTAVETLINFAANSMGNYQLVSVQEQKACTYVEFHLAFPMRDIDGGNVNRVIFKITADSDAART